MQASPEVQNLSPEASVFGYIKSSKSLHKAELYADSYRSLYIGSVYSCEGRSPKPQSGWVFRA